jgi:nitrous oxidase accessory protein NosD
MIDGNENGDVIHITADGVTITGFTIKRSGGNPEDAGIDIQSECNIISDNIITNNLYSFNNYYSGIRLNESSRNYVYNNIIALNDIGINVSGNSIRNHIYHNSFINNLPHAHDATIAINQEANNKWYNGYPSGGNYWDYHHSNDEFHGTNQNMPGRDGIVDNPSGGRDPFSISGGRRTDQYPLKEPFYTAFPGDLNNDGTINFTDLILFSNAWLASFDDLNYLRAADMNLDGSIDFIDFTLFANVYGTSR